MNLRRVRAFCCLLLLYGMAISTAFAQGELESHFNAVFDEPRFKQAHWGVLVADQATGDVLFEKNADKLFVPASTTKLYSVATALSTLGADYRFHTPIYAVGGIEDGGILRGDLVLVASGDLTMGGRTNESGGISFRDDDHTYASLSESNVLTSEDPLAGIKELARQVQAAGIKSLQGDVLIDDRLFDHATSTGSGPERITPILINDNVIDLVITPTAPGELASVTWRPKSAAVVLDSQVVTIDSPDRIEIHVRQEAGNRIVVSGEIANKKPPITTVVEVEDPASFARAVLIEELRNQGIRVAASPLVRNDSAKLPSAEKYPSAKKVAELVSPPFSENAKLVLKVSHNLHASTLPLLVAAKHGERTLDQGLRRQHEFLLSAGVDASTISFGGGAGGDRADYTTPRATVQLLRHMAQRADYNVYHEAMPILGVDGTLALSVPMTSPARGKFFAKTGTLLWQNRLQDKMLLTSKALGGYGTTAKDRKVVYAFFVNHVHLDKPADRAEIGKVLGRLCEVVYECAP